MQTIPKALYEIRVLLSSYLGSSVTADISVRAAAHIAYALHNEAAAVHAGKSYDLSNAVQKLKAIDVLLNENISERIL